MLVRPCAVPSAFLGIDAVHFFAGDAESHGSNASIIFSFECRTHASAITVLSQPSNPVDLNRTQLKTLAIMLNHTIEKTEDQYLTFDRVLPQAMHIDSANKLTEISGQDYRSIELSLSWSDTSAKRSEAGLPMWKLGSDDRNLKFQFASDMIAPIFKGADAIGSFTVIGLYLGVVYTIGRFLRLAYTDTSKRIMYEELPDPNMLINLCNGIYIARIHGDLQKEWDLYFGLVRIYRSAEMLYNVSMPVGEEGDGHGINREGKGAATEGNPFLRRRALASKRS
jgi:hypothetical protein